MLMRKIQKQLNRLADKQITQSFLKQVKPARVENSEYVFLFNQVFSKFTEKLYILVSYELSKRGIAACFLYNKQLLGPYYPQLNVNGYEISNSLTAVRRGSIKSLHEMPLSFEWAVDIGKNYIAAEGINFFPFIRSTLRKMQKRYNVSFNDEDIKELVQSCDLLLKYFLLLKEYAQKNQKKIRLVGYEAVYIPNGILRMLCDRLSQNRDIEFIELRRGYMYYFGQHHHRASYISSSNLTKTKMETGLQVSKQELAEFDGKDVGLDRLLKPVSSALDKSIDGKTSYNQEKVITAMQEYRANGKNIFVLFAHVFYDTPVYDESNAFNGMCEWILQTVEHFKGKEDLLLIKPHPGELIKDQPKRTPNETLKSFLSDSKLSENIILLERDLFTVKDLSKFISCGLIWRSSVAMELTFLKIPCIIAGSPPYTALSLNYAENREHYFHMIAQAHTLQVTDEQKIEAAKYLYLLENKHVNINCIAYEGHLKKFYWDRKALKRYLKEGNIEIESVVENLLA